MKLPWMVVVPCDDKTVVAEQADRVLRLGQTWPDLDCASAHRDLGGEVYPVASVALTSDGRLEIEDGDFKIMQSPRSPRGFRTVQRNTTRLAVMGCACLRWQGDVLSALGLGERPNLDIWKVPPLTLELILDDPLSDPDRRAFSWRARVTGVRVEHPSSDYLDEWHRRVRTTAATEQ
jgi:hypothetical protein